MKMTAFFLLVCLMTTIAAQTQPQWSAWGGISCFKGFTMRVKSNGFNKEVNKYNWIAEVKNNYSRRVHFTMYWKVGSENKTIGRFSLNPGDVTNAVSYFFTSSDGQLYLSVNNVCFGDNWMSCGGTGACYAICDNGTPNIPADCSGQKPVSGEANNGTSSGSVPGMTPSGQETYSGNYKITNNPEKDGQTQAILVCRNAAIDELLYDDTKKNTPATIAKLEAEYNKNADLINKINELYQNDEAKWTRLKQAYNAHMKKICQDYFPGDY